jgi:hypothetical protein
VTKEVIVFCFDYVDKLCPIRVPVSWHKGRLIGKGHLGKKSINANDHASLSKAHFTVLQQSALVAPYIEEHKQIIRSKYPWKSETWITKNYIETFPTWLRTELMANEDIHEQLAWLAKGPSNTILMYQGYKINGYTFYTRSHDKKSTNQNSGVRIEAIDTNGQSNSYFGYIEEIWELDYGPLKIPLFRC